MPFRFFGYFLVLILLLFIPAGNLGSDTGLTLTVYAAEIQNQLSVKSPTRIVIADQEVNLNDPGASLQINLPGVEGQPQVFNIPVTVEYQDGTTRYFGFVFNYQPRQVPSPTPEPTSEPTPEPLNLCDYEEDAPSCPYGGLQTCSGTWQDDGGVWICKYDDRVNPNCRDIRCNEPPASTPEPTAPPPGCGDYEFKYPDCDWDNQQVVEVWQDSCGEYQLRNAHTEPGQCGAPSDSEPPPEPSCSDDSYYCDENVGWLIHKHGGYWDGSECQYAFDWVEPC